MSNELKRLMYVLTLDFLKKSINKQEKILSLNLHKEDSFTKNAKITQRNAKNQNKLSLIVDSLNVYKRLLKELEFYK